MLRARHLLAALAVHAIVYLLMGARPVPIVPVVSSAIEVEVGGVMPVEPPAGAAAVAPSAALRRSQPGAAKRRTSESATGQEGASQAEQSPPVAPGRPESDAPPSSVELFPRGVLDGIAGSRSTPEWGGHRRHEGDGRPAPGTVDRETERAEVGRRVEGFLDKAMGAERVRSGAVPPKWRDLERRLREGFAPGLATVKEHNVARTYLDQVLAVWKRGEDGLRKGTVPGSREPESAIDRSVQGLPGVPEGSNSRALPLEQAMAAQAATAQPAVWWTTEVEAIVDSDGTLVSVRVVMPSGRRKLDQAAVAAVTQALAEQGPPSEGRRMVSLWSVGAALQVLPPTAIGFNFDESGKLKPGATGREKYIDFVYPLKQRVLTRVSLVSISPAR